MDTLIFKTARAFGVPEEVVDVIGRDFIGRLTEELPIMFLPAFMSELKRLVNDRIMFQRAAFCPLQPSQRSRSDR